MLTKERMDELSDVLKDILDKLPEVATWKLYRAAADIEYVLDSKTTVTIPTPTDVNYLRWGYAGDAPKSTARMLMASLLKFEGGKWVPILEDDEVEFLYLTFYAYVVQHLPEGDSDIMFKLRDFYKAVVSGEHDTIDYKDYCLDFYSYGEDPRSVVVVTKEAIENKPATQAPDTVKRLVDNGNADDTYVEELPNGGFVRKLKPEIFATLSADEQAKYNEFYANISKLNK